MGDSATLCWRMEMLFMIDDNGRDNGKSGYDQSQTEHGFEGGSQQTDTEEKNIGLNKIILLQYT